MPAFSRGRSVGTRSGSSRLSRPRSPGCVASWRSVSVASGFRRSPWGSWEKHTSSWKNSPRARTTTTPGPRNVDGHYRDLVDADVPSRAAAVLVGIPRATATRAPTTPQPKVSTVPANKLSALERAEILALVNSTDFVDLPPIQIYAKLLDEGIYLGSISTIYRVLDENN